MDEKIIFNYSKLKGRIVEMYNNQKSFSQVLSISDTSLYKKLNNEVYFTQGEIFKMVNALQIPENEIVLYFFCTNSLEN